MNKHIISLKIKQRVELTDNRNKINKQISLDDSLFFNILNEYKWFRKAKIVASFLSIRSEIPTNNLNEFLDDINKIYQLDSKYLVKQHLDENSENYLSSIRLNFTNEYEEIFNSKSIDLIDKLFNDNNILLIDNISLSNIWNQINNKKDKNIIIQYVNVFYSLIKINNSSKSGECNNIDSENFLKELQ